MSVTYIPVALRRLIEQRANQRCEYCQLPAGIAFFPHKAQLGLQGQPAVGN